MDGIINAILYVVTCGCQIIIKKLTSNETLNRKITLATEDLPKFCENAHDNDAHVPLIHNNNPHSQDQSTSTSFSSTITSTRQQNRSGRRVLIIDDEPDITLTFKAGLEDKSKEFQVYTYNDPISLLGEFKPNFYDLILMTLICPI